jgi:hypothetical protein
MKPRIGIYIGFACASVPLILYSIYRTGYQASQFISNQPLQTLWQAVTPGGHDGRCAELRTDFADSCLCRGDFHCRSRHDLCEPFGFFRLVRRQTMGLPDRTVSFLGFSFGSGDHCTGIAFVRTQAALALTLRTPGGGAAGDGGVTKRSAMNRAAAAAFPFLVNEPVARRIGEIFAESFERATDNPFRPTEDRGAFART